MQKEYEIISERLARIEQALSIKKSAVFMTSDEFCEMTGMSKNTFYQTRKNLPITPYYFGRKLRFKRADVEIWLSSTMSKTPFAFVPAQQ